MNHKPTPDRAVAAPPDDLHADGPRLWLSALADGDATALDRACAHWRDDAEARRSWHDYHLIGDVLRSDELAQPLARDAVFLQGFRERLAQEPVVLAPTPTPKPVPWHAAGRWRVPMAAAAGFVAVAGVLGVVRMSAPDAASGGAVLAAASGAGVTRVSSDAAVVNAANAADAANPAPGRGVLLRDARLDEFLRAHQAARGGVAVAAPGGALRRVEVVVPAGTER